jgi:predicted secreted Zn-dependent protease
MKATSFLRAAAAFLVMAPVAAGPAAAASVSKTYSYFAVGGADLGELERELARLGPEVRSTGQRHPGATQLEFAVAIDYGRDSRGCRIRKATVTVAARIILPRWRTLARVEHNDRIVWNTLSADIKRHEERHVGIAKNHAREIEQALEGLDRARDCDRLAGEADRRSSEIMRRHDEAQARFDRIEGINFESRMLRLLRYRLERIQQGNLRE